MHPQRAGLDARDPPVVGRAGKRQRALTPLREPAGAGDEASEVGSPATAEAGRGVVECHRTGYAGGGGGVADAAGSNSAGGAGGSGVVILSIPTINYSGTTTGSPTVTTNGSYTVLTYTSSGTYTA